VNCSQETCLSVWPGTGTGPVSTLFAIAEFDSATMVISLLKVVFLKL
jgi:hypothetical protein